MTDWTMPVTVLAGGAIAGAAVVWRARTGRIKESDTNLLALVAERDALIVQLRELTNDEGRYDLELRAAKIWRELDQERKKPKVARSLSFRLSVFRGFGWGVGVVVVLAGLLFLVDQSATNRQETNSPSLMQLMNDDPGKAEEVLQQAIAADPSRLDALVHLAVLYAQSGRTNEALAAYEQAVRQHPDQAAALAPLLEEIHKTAPAAPVALAGTIDLRRGTAPTGTVVYVIAREVGGGPPIAVAKLAGEKFPLPFTLSVNHSMTGGSLPEKVRLEARIDSDGDAATKSAGDPSGAIEEIPIGSQEVQLILQ